MDTKCLLAASPPFTPPPSPPLPPARLPLSIHVSCSAPLPALFFLALPFEQKRPRLSSILHVRYSQQQVRGLDPDAGCSGLCVGAHACMLGCGARQPVPPTEGGCPQQPCVETRVYHQLMCSNCTVAIHTCVLLRATTQHAHAQ